MRHKAELLDAQNFQLNTQLAQPNPRVTDNNRIVGMIIANVATSRQIASDEERVKEKLAIDRKALNDAEAAYAETVLALRRDLNTVQPTLDESLNGESDQDRVESCQHEFWNSGNARD